MTEDEILNIIRRFYPDDTELRRTLLLHSEQVRGKALEILSALPETALTPAEVSAGAMLHDIGICRCHAPDIFCTGTRHYLEHGLAGAEMLRSLNDPALEPYARICERHTGSGLTAEEIRNGGLPLPDRDFLPETALEQLICLADKFFSKSGTMQEKTVAQVRRSMMRFGGAPLKRFDALCRTFYIPGY